MKTHFSFDLWMTLIKSHPDFKKERDKVIWKYFNSENKSLEEVSRVIRKIDIESNIQCEKTGIHLNSYHIWYRILTELEHKNDHYYTLIYHLSNSVNDLFLRMSPELYDVDTKYILRELYERECTMNILSNTGFIGGPTLNIMLNNLGISRYFNFKIYSDECGFSKPNIKMFELMKKQCSELYVEPSKILHVGDNIIADGYSVKRGIDYLQINSNNKSITNVLEYL